jgi:bifunctional UDP-N-acetylglucosamine pyrophosphorylase/glucosamine-1-phosphate N-acetyltransferase
MSNGRLAVVILAAGKGTRMKSDLPKALQPICGEPMLGCLLRAAEALKPAKTLVVAGHQIGYVRDYLGKRATVVEQKEQLGSGHAVMAAEKALKNFTGTVMVLYCDTPLVTTQTMRGLLRHHRQYNTDCTLLSTDSDNPTGYGRIKRNSGGAVLQIVEDSEATPQERAIREINVGSYVFKADKLFKALRKVGRSPKKNEYYLTDAVGVLAEGNNAGAIRTSDPREVLGVNTPKELAAAETIRRKEIVEGWMERGVRFRDPATAYIDQTVTIGEGTVILANTVVEEGSVIGKGCVIGPFARIRGGSRIADGCTIGNFVEIVRSDIGRATQVKHLTYLGDARLGAHVNVGAGTITANYDGKLKHKTVVKDGAHLGSGTVLIAPVTIGKNAVTGAGSVVTKHSNVKDGSTVAGVPARELNVKKAKKGNR